MVVRSLMLLLHCICLLGAHIMVVDSGMSIIISSWWFLLWELITGTEYVILYDPRQLGVMIAPG